MECQESQKIDLAWKTQPDNNKGASGLADWRWKAAKMARERIALSDASDGVDDYAASADWLAGRLGDAAYIDAQPGEKMFAVRRIFAVMYARSCALNDPREARPLNRHMREFEQYLDGYQSFPELLFSVNGWSLDTLLAAEEVLKHDGVS